MPLPGNNFIIGCYRLAKLLMDMDRINIVRIAGILLLAAGALLFIVGVLTVNKFLIGSGFMSAVVAAALFYYTWRVTLMVKE